MDAVEDTVADAVTNVKQGMNNALSSGMAFMKDTSNAMTEKAEEMGEDLKEAGNDLMKHVPLKDHVEDAVEDLMADKMKAVDQMADDLMADTEDMVKEMGAGVDNAMSMIGLPKVSNSGDFEGLAGTGGMNEESAGEVDGKISSKTPIQSMDSFKTGSPEPELKMLEERMSQDSPQPSSNVVELVDLEETTAPMAPPPAVE